MSKAEEEVYVVACSSGNETNYYHTDRDCPNLSKAREVHTYPKDHLDDRRDECQICQDGFSHGRETDRSTWRAAVEAGPEEISQ